MEAAKKVKKTTPEQEAEAYELVYVERKTYDETAKEMRLTKDVIKGACKRHAKRNNIELPNLTKMKPKPFTDEQEDEMMILVRQQGWTVTAVAEKFGTSRPTVDRCIKSSSERNESLTE